MIDPSTGIRTQAPPSSDWTDRPDIPEFEECLGTTKDMSDDECILVLRGRPESCDDMVVPSYKTGTCVYDLSNQIKEDEVEADRDNLSTGNEMMKKKRLKLKKKKKMKTIRSDGFVQQRHPQVLAIAAKRQLVNMKIQIADYRHVR
eukprot:s4425_g3.t1